MAFEQIMTIVVAAGPSLAAIIGIIAAVIKNKNICSNICSELKTDFNEVKQEVINTKEYSELKSQLKIAHQENRELRKKLNELLTKMDHIYRNEDED